VLGSQVSKWDTAEMGEYVKLYEAPVAVPRARSKRPLLCGQPLHREVDTEGRTHAPFVLALAMYCSERRR
jgi:hypothetical protein